MGIATEAWFRGLWRVARIITDPEGRRTAIFAGTCRFAPDGAGLVCREAGVLRLAGARYPAERVTLWRFPRTGRVEVLFADGNPFHNFAAGQPEVEHLCGPDRYRVAYSFAEDLWHSRWVVTGPAKHYVMTTRYRRASRAATERAAWGVIVATATETIKQGTSTMTLKHLIGALLLASVSTFALVSVPHPAEADPPGSRFCPPGLAKKNPPCIPPGQAKKFHRGDYIPNWRDYRRFDYRNHGLRAPGPGRHYIRIGGDVYLIAEATQRVIEAINLLNAAGR